MPIRLTPLTSHMGEDTTSRLLSQMVPLGGERTFTMEGNPDGAARLAGEAGAFTTQLRGSPNAISQITITGTRVSHGFAAWVVGARASLPALELLVAAPRRLRVAFRRVSDNAGNATTRSAAAIASMLRGANAILERQANISLVSHSVESLRLARDLGDAVDGSARGGQPGGELELLVPHRASDAEITVFLVNEYARPGFSGDVAGVGFQSHAMIVLQDQLQVVPGIALAHEIVHTLGVLGHTNKPGMLMSDGIAHNQTQRWRLSREQILLLNPAPSWTPPPDPNMLRRRRRR